MPDRVVHDASFATGPESLERDTTDLSCALVQQVTAAEINNFAIANDDPVVPVAHAGLDTAYLQPAFNPEMRAEFEHPFKVATSPKRRRGTPTLRSGS